MRYFQVTPRRREGRCNVWLFVKLIQTNTNPSTLDSLCSWKASQDAHDVPYAVPIEAGGLGESPVFGLNVRKQKQRKE